jgi:hypothetical protein
MASSPLTTHCIFCDDVRQEIGSKMSFMGIYSDELLVPPPLPVFLPRFAVVVWLKFNVDDRPIRALTVRVTPPTKQDAIVSIMALPEHRPVHEGATTQSWRMVVHIAGLAIKETGTIDVEVETERGLIRVDQLPVRLIDASSPKTKRTASRAKQSAPKRLARRSTGRPAGRRRGE